MKKLLAMTLALIFASFASSAFADNLSRELQRLSDNGTAVKGAPAPPAPVGTILENTFRSLEKDKNAAFTWAQDLRDDVWNGRYDPLKLTLIKAAGIQGALDSLKQEYGWEITPSGNGSAVFNGKREVYIRNWAPLYEKQYSGIFVFTMYYTTPGAINQLKIENSYGQFIVFDVSASDIQVTDANLPFSAGDTQSLASPELSRSLSDNRVLSQLLTTYWRSIKDAKFNGTFCNEAAGLLSKQNIRDIFLKFVDKNVVQDFKNKEAEN
jgi:hypothetical protein